jgi:hypothetical protein
MITTIPGYSGGGTMSEKEESLQEMPVSEDGIVAKSDQAILDEAQDEAADPRVAIERSKAAYRGELPELLKTNFRQWVAYADGRRVRIGTSQIDLYRHCLEDLKLTHDRFIVRCIIPESSPDIEVIPR